MGGHSVNGAFRRATRPPSWSMLTQSGQVGDQPGGLVGQLGDLPRLGDVAREQNDAAQAELACQGAQFHGQLEAVEAGHEEPTDLTPE